MRHRRLAVIGMLVAASAAVTWPAQADVATDVYDTVTGTLGVYPVVPDITGGITIPYPDSAADDDGGGGSGSYSQRYCGKYQWNDGTQAGDRDTGMQPCLGGSNRDYLVGTGTEDNPGGSQGADAGWGDILVGNGGDDNLSGGRSIDHLWGDSPNGDGPTDGDDVLDGGVGNDLLTGGGGNDQMFGGAGGDYFYAVDGERDFIYCASDADEADDGGAVDYIEYDRNLDVIDEATCFRAEKHPQ